MPGADYTRTCEGCGHIVMERGFNGEEWARCFAPSKWAGRTVSDSRRRFLPYVPAWCPVMQGKEAALSSGKRKSRR